MAANRPGTTGHKLVNVDHTMVRPKVPAPTTMTAAGRRHWKKLVDSVPNDYFTISDYPVLATYCEAMASMTKASKMLAKEGEIIENAKGDMVVNPWHNIQQAAQQKIGMMCTKLCLSPSTRTKNDRNHEKPTPSIASTKLGGLIKR